MEATQVVGRDLKIYLDGNDINLLERGLSGMIDITEESGQILYSKPIEFRIDNSKGFVAYRTLPESELESNASKYMVTISNLAFGQLKKSGKIEKEIGLSSKRIFVENRQHDGFKLRLRDE